MANRNDKKERFYRESWDEIQDRRAYELIDEIISREIHEVIEKTKRQSFLKFYLGFDYACKKLDFSGSLQPEYNVHFENLGRYKRRKYSLRESY